MPELKHPRKPTLDEVIDGTRVRVYATRDGYEVICHDDDYADMASDVRVYPKQLSIRGSALQCLAERGYLKNGGV